MHIIDILQDKRYIYIYITNIRNKIIYIGKKYLTSLFFHGLEVFSNIEYYWVARRDFYKLLTPNICAYVVNNLL